LPRVSSWMDGSSQKRAAAPLPLSFPFSLFSSPSFHARHSFLSLSSFSSHRRPHTRERDRDRRENVTERESCCLEEEEEEEEEEGFLECSVQPASTASINDHPWSDRAETFQGGSQHVNLRCERWRSDLEQPTVIL
jgi:hypothetical protein